VGRRKVKKVIILMDMIDYFIQHKVRRIINHLTVLTCVAASGDALCPMTLTLRKVPDEIYQVGHRPSKDFLIKRHAKPDIDHMIFERFIRHHPIPHITALRIIPCYPKAEAVLVMDA
jgi:hypothetical protein